MVLNVLIVALFLGGPAKPAERPAVQVAQTHFEAGNYAEAVKTLTSAYNTAPDDPAVNYWLARSYYEQRNYDRAIAYAEQAVKSSANGEYYRWLGRAYGAKAEQSHSFFLARKVKEAFQAAVNLAPRSIDARRDLMQYLLEAPWIVGGDKDKAKQEIDSISKLDPVEGHLARAAYWSTEKKWKDAEKEYLAALDQHPTRVDPYMEAAQFFVDRKDADNLDRVLAQVHSLNLHDPRLNFYRAVTLILHHSELSTAQELLNSYIASVPQRSDYPSHNQALVWLRAAR